MGDDLQGAICSGNWWSSSPRCSAGIDDGGIFGWSGHETVDVKTVSCEDQSVSVSDSSMVFQQKPQGSDSAGSSALMDSTLQMMEFGTAPAMDWSQETILNGGRADNNNNNNNNNFLHESMMESSHNPRNSHNLNSSMAVFTKQINNQGHLSLSSESGAGACTITCQGLPASFAMESPVQYGYQTSFLQGLYEPEPNYPFQPNYGLSSNELNPSWQKFPSISPSRQLASNNQLHFSNKTPFWNPSATSMSSTAATNARGSFFSPVQNQFSSQVFEEKPSCSNYSIKNKHNEARDSGSVLKKATAEPALKRPRLETPSPLPTFKVRKEKLGDRVTALQQLVSPFGKTDTASVLFEAIEYIKFLHEQVTVLSAPYMKNGGSTQHPHQHHQQSPTDKSKDGEGPQKDLRSRGLCLVPMTSIFPVTNETTADFWTPTFGGTYR